MADRSHLTSIRFASALISSCWQERYTSRRFGHDVVAGLTVGLISIPLSMALSIAIGLPPQYGLYTGIVAGLVIALTGGSRLSVSGPTAAFVVVLQPIVAEFGLGGLLFVSWLAGLILMFLALVRFGQFIEYIPTAVTQGFITGIAVILAVLQIKDFFGLPLTHLPSDFVEKIGLLLRSLDQLHWPSMLVGTLTLLALIAWPARWAKIPKHLPAVLLGLATALLLDRLGYPVATIASEFSFNAGNGQLGHGIPPMLPQWGLPWQLPLANGHQIMYTDTLRSFFIAACTIAVLGAIESLLSAVTLDQLTQQRHNSNGELLGQGLGNLAAPLFGGFAASASLSRSLANYSAGATSPVAAVIHALVLVLAILVLAPVLNWLPMPAMAALLLLVAWEISGIKRIRQLFRREAHEERLVFLVCLSLTVLFDMVVAISVGIVMAALMFMRQVAAMTRVTNVSKQRKLVGDQPIPTDWKIIKISGPLFFAAADRVFDELLEHSQGCRGVLLYMDAVSVLDSGGLRAMLRFVEQLNHRNIEVLVADLQFQPLKTLVRAQIQPITGQLAFFSQLSDALSHIHQRRTATDPTTHST